MGKGFVEIDYEGFKELDKVLAGLKSQGFETRQLVAINNKVLQPVVKDARTYILASDWASKEVAKSIKARKMKGTYTQAASSVGPNTKEFHGVFFEKGFRSRRKEEFMKPAWEKNRAKMLRDYVKTAWFILDRTAQRLIKQAGTGKLSRQSRKVLA